MSSNPRWTPSLPGGGRGWSGPMPHTTETEARSPHSETGESQSDWATEIGLEITGGFEDLLVKLNEKCLERGKCEVV